MRALMGASEKSVGWFRSVAEERQAAGPTGTSAKSDRPAGSERRRTPMTSANDATIRLALISVLVILAGIHAFFADGVQMGSDAADGAIDAIRDLIGIGLILVGIGILARLEVARRFYFLLSAIAYLAIVAGSANSSFRFTALSLALQTIPVIFLLRPSVSATFR